MTIGWAPWAPAAAVAVIAGAEKASPSWVALSCIADAPGIACCCCCCCCCCLEGRRVEPTLKIVWPEEGWLARGACMGVPVKPRELAK
eukprot:1156142-Pelagomonas_calceolata.AAC.12